MGALFSSCLQNVQQILAQLQGAQDAPTTKPIVVMDKTCKGNNVTLSNWSVAGTGVALAACAIHQEMAYWEVKITKLGNICVGVSRKLAQEKLEGEIGDGQSSWALNLASIKLQEGDVLGVGFDQSAVPCVVFYKNGDKLPQVARKVKGLVYPAVSVGNGAMVEFTFDEDAFKFPIAQGSGGGRGFQGLIPARDII